MKWQIITFIVFGILLLIGGYMAVKKDISGIEREIGSRSLSSILSTAKNQNNSFIVKDGFSKTYIANENRIQIKNALTNETFLDISLLSSDIEWGLVAGSDTQVAEFWLYDFKNLSLSPFNKISIIDTKTNKTLSKIIRIKYGIDTLYCDKLTNECENITSWTEFTNVTQLPFKSIRIGLFANTNTLERVEWVPELRGFDFTEWAIWDVSTATYNNKNYSVGSNPSALYMNETGNGIYVALQASNPANSSVFGYYLSTPKDVSTAVNISGSCNITVGAKDPSGLAFNISDGVKMYVANTTKINRYTLNPGWNVSSCSLDGNTFNTPVQTHSIFFNDSLDKLFMVFRTGTANATVHSYTLSTAGDLTTASHDTGFCNVSAVLSNPRDIYVRPDGLKFYLVDNGATDRVYQYSMGAWDISSCTNDNINFTTNGQESTSLALAFSRDGTTMYTAGVSAGTIFQYDMTDIVFPNWSNPYTNSTLAGTTINHSVNWTDNINLSGFIFSFDNGNGSFLNDTWVSMTGTANQSNSTKDVNSTVGTTIQWKVYANDSVNNLNVTNTFSYITIVVNPQSQRVSIGTNSSLFFTKDDGRIKIG